LYVTDIRNEIKNYENYDEVEQLDELKKTINKIETELKYIKDKYRS